ncbi:MAG: FMN-binding protein [Ruminococcus sp.]
MFKRAEALIATVIGQQSTEVDAVSGATFSSEGILEAIDDALNAAKKAGEPAVTTTVTTETTACTGTSDTASSTERPQNRYRRSTRTACMWERRTVTPTSRRISPPMRFR